MDNPPLETNVDRPLASIEPHITLASVPASFPADSLKNAIPRVTAPLRIDFESVEAQQTYFRSAIVNICKTPELEGLLAAVRRALRPLEVKAPSYPHMSLFYVDDARASDRQHILDTLFQSGHLIKGSTSDRLAINFTPEDELNANLLHGFIADAIWVVLCEGPVNEWKVLYKRSLQCVT